VVKAPTGIGRRLKNALAHGGQTEKTVFLEEPKTLDADLLREEEALGESGGGGDPTGPYHVYGRVTA